MSEPPLRESWFARPPPPEPMPPDRPSDLPLEKPEGSPSSTALVGFFCGAIGGVVMLVVATAVARHGDPSADTATTIGLAVPIVAQTPYAGQAVASLAGGVLGAMFGWLTRHLFRIVPRMVFGAVLAPILWLLVDVFFLLRFAPRLAAACGKGKVCKASTCVCAAGMMCGGMCVNTEADPKNAAAAVSHATAESAAAASVIELGADIPRALAFPPCATPR